MSEAGKFLNAHQWSWKRRSISEYGFYCIDCYGSENDGHVDTCELAAILKEEFFDVQYAVPRE